ncbi:methyl-accepting chemotaxis protein [Glaciecola sp. 2405UD65-10]|uniref:methyl-accepting chemotaxis protein n=1 Tax=Glaciecola sp. 2405UD65-10 TaxID=3397244 RepID=UPI003B591A16
MTMKHKLVMTLILLAILPMAVSIVASTLVAKDSGSDALLRQTELRLISERESKKRELETAFELYRNQIVTKASSTMTIEAANSMIAPADYYADSVITDVSMAQMKAAVEDYYQNKFGAEYARRNSGKTASIAQMLGSLSDNAIALQYSYIAANTHPLGEKHNLDKALGQSVYNDEHARYHSSYRNFVETFGYYDLFIVDSDTGNIIYSVFKELDFATSLINGPYAQSGIGKVFKEANAANEAGAIAMADFASYLPSYDAPASFMATPIFSNGQKIAVLILQLPVEKIDEITTSHESWKDIGLGVSGETYLVGADSKMRSVSRFFIESPEKYMASAKAHGLDDTTAKIIGAQGTTANLQTIKSDVFKQAIAGESGFGASVDYRGIPVLTAYAKLDIPGLEWAILSEMDVAEAVEPAKDLSNTLLLSSAIVASILSIFAIACGLWFSNKLTRPIEKLQDDIEEIERNSDLATRLRAKPSDVTAGIVGSLNKTFEKIHGIVNTVATNSDQMLHAADNVRQVSASASTAMAQQNAETDRVAKAMDEMTTTVDEIANNSSDANTAANDANQQAQQGNQTVIDASESINDLAQAVKEAALVINKLASDSESIGSVLDVIRGIAEQTNLLALNAAIEAARAGEQGRGFAVVADEVRTLASRTQESTEEIQAMIQTLQTGAANAVSVMNSGEKQTETSVNKAREAADALQKISAAITHITQMNQHIAESSEQQRAMSNNVTSSIDAIKEISISTTQGAHQMETESSELTQIVKSLKKAVGQFRL